MFNSYGLIAVLILALINAQFALTENEYFPGMYVLFIFVVLSLLVALPLFYIVLSCYYCISKPFYRTMILFSFLLLSYIYINRNVSFYTAHIIIRAMNIFIFSCYDRRRRFLSSQIRRCNILRKFL